LADVCQRSRLISQLDEEHFRLRERRAEAFQDLNGFGPIVRDQTKHAMLMAIHDRQAADVDLFALQGGEDIGQAARLVFQEDRHLLGGLHEIALLLMTPATTIRRVYEREPALLL